MGQLTVRASDQLLMRVRAAATAHGASINEFVTSVLDAATNPDLAGTEVDRLRERLSLAGLWTALPEPTRMAYPSKRAVAAARAAAGTGTALSHLVSDGRE